MSCVADFAIPSKPGGIARRHRHGIRSIDHNRRQPRKQQRWKGEQGSPTRHGIGNATKETCNEKAENGGEGHGAGYGVEG